LPEADLPSLVQDEDGQFVPVPPCRPPPIPPATALAGRQATDRRGAWPQSAPTACINPVPPGPVNSGFNFGTATPPDTAIGNTFAQIAALQAQAQASAAHSMPAETNNVPRLEQPGDASNLDSNPSALAHKLLMAAGIHLQQKQKASPKAFPNGGRGYEQRAAASSETFHSNSSHRSFGSGHSYVSGGSNPKPALEGSAPPGKGRSADARDDFATGAAWQLSDVGSDHGKAEKPKAPDEMNQHS